MRFHFIEENPLTLPRAPAILRPADERNPLIAVILDQMTHTLVHPCRIILGNAVLARDLTLDDNGLFRLKQFDQLQALVPDLPVGQLIQHPGR